MRLTRLLVLTVASVIVVALAVPALGAEPAKVNFGLLPYLDWMPWVLAQNEGYCADEGLKLEFVTFPDDPTVAQAVVSGDIDIGSQANVTGLLAAERFPNLRLVSMACGFLGYAIMVRPEDVYPKGKVKTYEQLYKEYAKKMSGEAAAKKAIADCLKQLKGKTIVMDRGTSSNLVLAAAVKAGKLDQKKIKLIDIPDVEGALAFMQGTGDFEIGGYPQVLGLGKQGCQKLITAKELGGAAVVTSGEVATSAWVGKEKGTLLKLRKIWYRTIDSINQNPSDLLPKLAKIINHTAGTSFTPEDVANTMQTISYWPTKKEAAKYFYTAGGLWYWGDVYGYTFDFWVQQGKLKKGSVDLKAYVIAPLIHQEFLAKYPD